VIGYNAENEVLDCLTNRASSPNAAASGGDWAPFFVDALIIAMGLQLQSRLSGGGNIGVDEHCSRFGRRNSGLLGRARQ